MHETTLVFIYNTENLKSPTQYYITFLQVAILEKRKSELKLKYGFERYW